jgi:hypothetical protein
MLESTSAEITEALSIVVGTNRAMTVSAASSVA